MKMNQKGLDLLKEFEGFRGNAYRDPVGIWTIGYGHTSMAGPPSVVPGMVFTKEQATNLLASDLGKYEAAVSDALTRTPNANQFSAMVSLCYNIGPGAFAKSTLVKHFNAGRMVEAAGAFSSWKKAGGKVLPGLVRRRAAEAALFKTPQITPQAVEPLSSPKQVDNAPTPATPQKPSKEPLTLQRAMVFIVGAVIAAIAAYLGFGE